VRARWLYKLAQPKRDRERERERERKRATSGRLKESGGVCDCVIGVLSLPLFRLRLNHATQKQKRERALYFLFAFVLECVHFGVLSLQMQNADVALSRETTDFIMFLYYFICLPVVLIIFKIFIFFYIIWDKLIIFVIYF